MSVISQTLSEKAITFASAAAAAVPGLSLQGLEDFVNRELSPVVKLLTNAVNARNGATETISSASTVAPDTEVALVSGTTTVTLRPASESDMSLTVVNTGSGTVTIAGSGTETINGSTTQTLSNQYDAYTVRADGATYYIIGKVT